MLTKLLSRLVAAMPPDALAEAVKIMDIPRRVAVFRAMFHPCDDRGTFVDGLSNKERLVLHHALRRWNLRTGKPRAVKSPTPAPVQPAVEDTDGV